MHRRRTRSVSHRRLRFKKLFLALQLRLTSQVRAEVFEDAVPRTDDLHHVLDEGLRSLVKRQQGGQVVCIAPRGVEHERRQSQSRSHSQGDITAAALGS